MVIARLIQAVQRRRRFPKREDIGGGRTINAEAYWNVVLACLREFHDMTTNEAQRCVDAYGERLQQLPSNRRKEVRQIGYNQEPFYLACDLAERELDVEKYGVVYDTILKRYKW